MSKIKIVVGGATLTEGSEFDNSAVLEATIELLNTHGINEIDSAVIYAGSELFIGRSELGSKGFEIDTKTPGGWQLGSSTREGVVWNLKESLARLQVKKVHIFYIHAPDKEVAFEETLAGINDAYLEGLFDRFGLSNFPPGEVETMYRFAEKMGYVLPTVYQGLYSPVNRKPEEVLLPLLKKLGISFYAYSPLSGGFLTKTKQQILDGIGRFDRSQEYGKMYEILYFKPAYLDSLDVWARIAEEEGVSNAELAYRWVGRMSTLEARHGDALVIGSRTFDQLKETLEFIEKGPLSEISRTQIDALWETLRHEAILDNFEAAR